MEQTLNSLSSNVEYEREKKMINIWDKIIREREKRSVCNKSRLIALKKVVEEYFESNLTNWETYCLNIQNSNFLMGGGANNWKADLTWAIKQENLIRVLEGYYHQKEEKKLKYTITGTILEEDEILSNDPEWNNVKENLKTKKGAAIYQSWFRKLSLVKYEHDKVLLAAPSKFIKEWIFNNYKDDIITSFKQTALNINEVEIFVRNEEGVLV